MPDVGHEASGNRKLGYARLLVELGIAVLLAFIGFTLQGLRADTKESLRVGQENAVAISRILSNQEGTNARLERLERTQDRTQQ